VAQDNDNADEQKNPEAPEAGENLTEEQLDAMLDALPADMTGHHLVQLLGSIIFSYSRTDREAFELWQETSAQVLGFLAERAAGNLAEGKRPDTPVH